MTYKTTHSSNSFFKGITAKYFFNNNHSTLIQNAYKASVFAQFLSLSSIDFQMFSYIFSEASSGYHAHWAWGGEQS